MQLDAELLAERAMQKPVDLHLWYRDMLLTLVSDLRAIRVPGGFIADDETDQILDTLHTKTFEELREGQWENIVELPPPAREAMREFESVIAVLGRYVPIRTKQDVQILRITVATTLKSDTDAMLHAIYETAAKQALSEAGIEPREHKRLRDSLDQNVLAEMNRVTALVRAKATDICAEDF